MADDWRFAGPAGWTPEQQAAEQQWLMEQAARDRAATAAIVARETGVAPAAAPAAAAPPPAPPAPAAPPAAGPQASVGEQLAGNETIAQFSPGPPRSQQEEQQRLSGWQRFLQEFQSNPSWQMVAMRLGTQLMQPVPVGQSSLGHFGGALQDSMNYYTAIQNAELVRQKQSAEIAATQAGTAQTQAQTVTEQKRPAKVEAETAAITEETSLAKELRGMKKEELRARIDKYASEGVLDGARAKALKESLEMNPKYQDAVIEELVAKAKYYRDYAGRGGAAGVGVQGRLRNEKAMTLLSTDPQLKEMAKTDPQQALQEALRRVDVETTSGLYRTETGDAKARATVGAMRRRYDELKAAGKLPRNMRDATFFDWALDAIQYGDFSRMPDAERTAVQGMLQSEEFAQKTRTPVKVAPGDQPPGVAPPAEPQKQRFKLEGGKLVPATPTGR